MSTTPPTHDPMSTSASGRVHTYGDEPVSGWLYFAGTVLGVTESCTVAGAA